MAQETNKKGKRKRWITILPTENFRVPEIGETLTADPATLVGKTISSNLMELTRDPKKQNLRIKFKITEIKDNKAHTEVVKYEMAPSSVKRMVRAGKSKADASLKFETKDKIQVIIKPVIITKAKTTNSVLTSLRKETESFLKSFTSKNSFSEVLNQSLSFKLQSQIRNHLKKTYPVAICHIRVLQKV